MITVDELLAANPFPGLRSFAATEADRFFGRRQQIEELVARIDEVSFLAVAGSSGSGKSSLVLAGLLNELEGDRDRPRHTEWRAAVMRPGNQPLANLAEQLAPVLAGGNGSEASSVGALYGRLGLGGLGLVEAITLARLPPHTRVLVVVDQFEEIFRFQRMTDPDEASAFVKLLLNAAREPQSPLSVIITLRSEFLGFCADFRDLPEAINRGQYLVPKLTREQRKEAIVNPVELRGFEIAPRVVQRLLNDVSDDFDDLPVMQHVLTRMWNKWANACQGSREIDLEDYKAAGTAKHALSNHADEAFESLPALKPVTEKVFRALTERMAEGTEVRRPIEFDRLCQVVDVERSLVAQVIERFRQPDTAFLMPRAEVPLAGNPVIDISHESLIRLWQRLRQWAELESESRAMLLRLVEAARRCDANQGSLWRGPDLAKALEWRQSTKPTPAWVALYARGNGAEVWQSAENFLAKSGDEVRRERWRGKLQLAGILGLLLAVLAGFLALKISRRAQSGELASRALEQLDLQPAIGARLALAAVELDANNERAEYALRQSLANLEIANREKLLDLKEKVLDARYSRDGTRLVTASGKTVTIFDTRTFEQLGERIRRDAVVTNAWLISKNTTVVTQTVDGHAQIQRIGGSRVKQMPCEGEGNRVWAVGVSSEETHVAVGCYNGEIRVWDVTDPDASPQEFTHRTKGPVTITALAFSTDGGYLASGDAGGVVGLWKVGRRDARVFPVDDSPIKHAGANAITVISFHPTDSSLLVTVAKGTEAIVWQVDLEHGRLELNEKKEPKKWVLKHERPVILAKFAVRADDPNPLFTASDKVVRLWVDATADPKEVRAHDDWVTDANVSADGELLVTGSSDGTARIWSTRSGAPVATLIGHRDSLTRAVISPDGKQVSTASSDGTVRVWRVRPPRLLFSAKRWILSAAFEPGGSRIAVGEEGRGSVLELNDGTTGSVAARVELEATAADQVTNISWSRDRKLLVAVQQFYDPLSPSLPVLWDAESKKQIRPIWPTDPGAFSVTAAVFNPASDELLTVHEGRIAVWDALGLSNYREIRLKVPVFGEEYSIVEVSPNGKWIAAANLNANKIDLYKREDLQSGPRPLEAHTGGIRSLQFSHDSKWLLTASRDRTSLIWSVDSSAPPKVLRGGHTAVLSWASFDADAKRVVTASADRTIRVWDTETLKELAVLRWHGEGVNEVHFSPDGRRILTASDDGTVKLGQCEACNLTVGQLRDRLEELANLSDDELRQVRSEIDATRYFKLPAFLSRAR